MSILTYITRGPLFTQRWVPYAPGAATTGGGGGGTPADLVITAPQHTHFVSSRTTFSLYWEPYAPGAPVPLPPVPPTGVGSPGSYFVARGIGRTRRPAAYPLVAAAGPPPPMFNAAYGSRGTLHYLQQRRPLFTLHSISNAPGGAVTPPPTPTVAATAAATYFNAVRRAQLLRARHIYPFPGAPRPPVGFVLPPTKHRRLAKRTLMNMAWLPWAPGGPAPIIPPQPPTGGVGLTIAQQRKIRWRALQQLIAAEEAARAKARRLTKPTKRDALLEAADEAEQAIAVAENAYLIGESARLDGLLARNAETLRAASRAANETKLIRQAELAMQASRQIMLEREREEEEEMINLLLLS